MITTKEQLTTFMESRGTFGIKPGLERVEYLLQAIHHPEKELEAVHVAGTNGKGSVIQFMQEALIENNYQVGVFTSPSFIGLKGHFLINRCPADEMDIIPFVNELFPAIKELDETGDGPTAFEIITVVAFMYFRTKVDIVLVETGMGGRYDTTNCFHPLVSVITNIAKDHMQFLGSTYAEIAYHKAGIIKKRIPAVIGRLNLEAEKVMQDEAVIKNAPLYELGKDFTNENALYNWDEEELNHIRLHSGLKGNHQIDNAALAFSALHLLRRHGFSLEEKAIFYAFAETTLPGRFEQISDTPFIILDSAHNVAGILAFLETMEETDDRAYKRLLFAGFKDKQLKTMLGHLIPYFENVTLTTFSHERAASMDDYNECTNTTIHLHDNWKHAVNDMLADDTYTHYYITGSLHFITMVRAYIIEKKR